MGAKVPEAPGEPPASPYGNRRTRWIKPAVIAALLVVFDEQGVFALLGGLFLLLVYLPRSLFAEKYRSCRKDRLIRFAIYLAAVVMVFGLRAFNTELARERAQRIIAAAESYKAANGRYPERLEQLVPRFIPEIPAKGQAHAPGQRFQLPCRHRQPHADVRVHAAVRATLLSLRIQDLAGPRLIPGN